MEDTPPRTFPLGDRDDNKAAVGVGPGAGAGAGAGAEAAAGHGGGHEAGPGVGYGFAAGAGDEQACQPAQQYVPPNIHTDAL
ncbi:hypothetical protein N7509_012641 [Penicillium cosmopolitanum]|uniref:Uncharacterized protein n=1 Tax=Penicillium cosmopolitanum TaxID=1131564 RepID=A0A9W9SJC8_9EURO|nr:uncharacterized protein N7509_012641 [Penicillium cosmopolitanum]KAJ5379522.1 hypothetical protein N7509_012641 [Penicillium cosmopolitanum]